MADTSNNAGEAAATATSTTMRAWQYTRAGNDLAAALTLRTTAPRPPTPTPADRLLVRVTHMSPNPADYKMAELGRLISLLLPRPRVASSPGMDYAGVVVEVGSAVDVDNSSSYKYKPGDAVFGSVIGTPFGSLGEYVQPTPDNCVPIPPPVSPADASTLGTAAATAYYAIKPYVTPGAGAEVFVNGGAGGVGTYAVQIAARALGCVVTTSCSARNAALCVSLGASTVLDYNAVDVSAALRARGPVFRLVVDNVGDKPADLYKAADDYLVPDGVFVQVGGELTVSGLLVIASRAFWPTALGGGKRAWKLLQEPHRHEDLAEVARWMQEGTIRAVVDGDVIPFEEAPEAYRKLKTGRTRGNLVVKVSD
ncbi:NAD(P)-binding protein [Nemania sp. NC0429]|nr:NAD(P)-binding protein [Nemania sp. NC0429]